MQPTPPLGQRLHGIVQLGLTVGLARYALEFTGSPAAMWIGVYYVMPIALLVIGLQRRWGDIGWLALLGTTAVLCLLVWGIPNTLAYTTGQFLGWQHGRFHYGGPDDPHNRAAPIAASTLGKLGWGVLQGLLTAVAGTIWCTFWATLFVWLPARLRRRRATPR
ncbi:MAG: hypothetical protein KF830_00570 [Planctomycetes bacterium]|nr:hypothetical protein [Planctomycetota bacterium]